MALPSGRMTHIYGMIDIRQKRVYHPRRLVRTEVATGQQSQLAPGTLGCEVKA